MIDPDPHLTETEAILNSQLCQRPGRPNWYIVWCVGRRSQRCSTGTSDYEEAQFMRAIFVGERLNQLESDLRKKEHREQLYRETPLARLRTLIRENPHPGLGCIYFIAAGKKAIKIGWARDVGKRLMTLQIGSPDPLTLIGWCYGSQHLERRIHEYFAKEHKRGEWFRPTKRLRAFINAAVSENGNGSPPF